MAKARCAILVIALGLWGFACGGDDTSAAVDAGVDATRSDAGVDATASDGGDGGVDNGEASTTYPAYRPSVPQIVKGTGSVMAAPKVRPVYFAGETLATQIDTGTAAWLASPTWTAQTSEYGVGAATLSSITLTESPPSMLTDAQIQAWLQAKLGAPVGDAGADAGDGGADPAFGATDSATLASEMFLLFYPAGTQITFGGSQSCSSFGSYHSSTSVLGKNVAYAVIPRCSATLPALEANVVFETIAIATDPYPTVAPAYDGFDPDHTAWTAVGFGSEVAHPCSQLAGVTLDGGFVASRTWSNAAIAALHDPCLPVDGTPYFASVPIMTDVVHATANVATKGVKVAVGQSKTIEVQLFSDGPTSGPWTVSAKIAPGSPPNATFAFDRTTGQNGEKLHLTVTATAAGTTAFIVTSTLGTRHTFWAGFVGQN